MPEQGNGDELEQQLRELAARFDPVPPRLLDAAVDSYTWRTVDSDLAELVFDSQAEDQAALVRGGEHARLVSFAAGDLVIDLEITGGGQDRRIIGQLAPPQRAAVEIRQGSDVTGLDTDELGRFGGTLHTGPFSLRCRTGAEPDRTVVTDWIAL